MAITVKQERVFEALRREIPGVEFLAHRCELIGNTAWISFRYVDPRPSKNLLIDDSLRGWICVGPRGGFKSAKIWGQSRGFGDGSDSFSDFWVTLSCYSGTRHSFYQ